YTGQDARLNIGPKGFTGEKYGGSTYWDTEAYCIPFYLSTAPSDISRNLLIYRYNHLEKAKENAIKLGLRGALYPMVTMNGEECHNEWEITFEEIHRNGAIAYAIYNYVRYTGDKSYLLQYGYEVLLEISRFWASRVNYNPNKKCYMILGVTGPNEYENNVNNNWYTNTIASWTLQYTLEVDAFIKENHSLRHNELQKILKVDPKELLLFAEIATGMYYPVVEELGIFEQQDGYMDKEQRLTSQLPDSDRPINQKWSWDHILRSCFIKQADVLQGIYFFQDRFDHETKRRNFDFYEARTVHESSLSPCIHAIIASQLGYKEKAYELYVRTARLDLDNYNNDSDDGLHITSMAGTWMSVVHGFGGFKIENDTVCLSPFLPNAWEYYSFRLVFRGRILEIEVNESVSIKLTQGDSMVLELYGEKHMLASDQAIKVGLKR
ncbi:MAG: glycoside hydrolase family 65 protein, partial [Vallitaleaceae bacterium]|nr:glycoside hydrolase family 65 protein [Vallitaleaceae bacterium]